MVYKWYILPIGGLYATYHLLGEPETTIDFFLIHHQPINPLITPHPGVLSGYFRAAELLLQAKAEVDTRNERNFTAFDLAVQPGI